MAEEHDTPTLHRDSDGVPGSFEALEQADIFGDENHSKECRQRNSAWEGRGSLLKALAEKSAGRIEILAGAEGLHQTHLAKLITRYEVSACPSVRTDREKTALCYVLKRGRKYGTAGF